MAKHSSGRVLTIAAVAFGAALAAGTAHAQQVLTNGPPAVIKISDDAWAKVGVVLQPTADWLQDSTGGYQQTMYIRRARFLLAGQLSKDLTFFFQTDAPNFFKASTTNGVTTKSNTFILQDAYMEWKPFGNDHFMIDAGEMLVPANRESITSITTFLALDIAAVSALYNAPTQSNVLRDVGFMAKGYLIGNGQLEYRLAVFDGVRLNGLRNSYRYSGYLSYEFFEPEKGYVVLGTYLGKKKVLNVSVGSDNQDNYHLYSINGFTALPVNGGDEIAAQYSFQHIDGEDFLTSLARQNTHFGEIGYYIHNVKTGPFVKYEQQTFSDPAQTVNDQKRYGGGFNFYPHGKQDIKLSFQFLRIVPDKVTTPCANEFTTQLQVFLF